MDGKAIGVWKRTSEKENIIINSEFFTTISAREKKIFVKLLPFLENFWEKKIELVF